MLEEVATGSSIQHSVHLWNHLICCNMHWAERICESLIHMRLPPLKKFISLKLLKTEEAFQIRWSIFENSSSHIVLWPERLTFYSNILCTFLSVFQYPVLQFGIECILTGAIEGSQKQIQVLVGRFNSLWILCLSSLPANRVCIFGPHTHMLSSSTHTCENCESGWDYQGLLYDVAICLRFLERVLFFCSFSLNKSQLILWSSISVHTVYILH